MNHLTFRNSKIIYYGPHPCDNCGVLVAKMGHEFGGNAFTYPDGPIYPNTEWHPHVCDPKRSIAMPTPTIDKILNYRDGTLMLPNALPIMESTALALQQAVRAGKWVEAGALLGPYLKFSRDEPPRVV